MAPVFLSCQIKSRFSRQHRRLTAKPPSGPFCYDLLHSRCPSAFIPKSWCDVLWRLWGGDSPVISCHSHLAHRSYQKNMRRGLKEPDTCRLVHAILLSCITHGTPCISHKPKKHAKLDFLMTKSYTTVLGFSAFTLTACLLQLGIHRPFSKLLKA